MTRNTTGEEEVSLRASVSANLYIGAALASFARQEWTHGKGYLQDAIGLDPGVWFDPAALERLLTVQVPKTVAPHHRQESAWVRDYVDGILSSVRDAIPLAKRGLHRIEGHMYAEFAYLSYLAGDQRNVRDHTRSALRAHPVLVRDVGMLKRAFSI